jgi:hypothetical protein
MSMGAAPRLMATNAKELWRSQGATVQRNSPFNQTQWNHPSAQSYGNHNGGRQQTDMKLHIMRFSWFAENRQSIRLYERMQFVTCAAKRALRNGCRRYT